jgi:hypothetical protein
MTKEQQQPSTWETYLTKFDLASETTIESLTYGDLRLLSSSNTEWKEQIDESKIFLSLNSVPQLKEIHYMKLTRYFVQMTNPLIQQAEEKKEIAMTMLSTLETIIRLSLQNSTYEFKNLELVGSTVNGLALETTSRGHLDMTLIVQPSEQSMNPSKLFEQLIPLLLSSGFKVTEGAVINPRVPILQIQHPDDEIDVSEAYPSLPSS